MYPNVSHVYSASAEADKTLYILVRSRSSASLSFSMEAVLLFSWN